MDINLFSNLQLNGAELKSVQKELSFEFGVQDFTIRAVEDNGAAKVVHVIHQGQTYTDPAYLANWQTWTDHVFNTIKPVIEVQEAPSVAPVLPTAPVVQPVQPVKPLIDFDDDDDEDDEPRKKSTKKQPAPKSKLPFIIIAVVAVLIIAAGAWWFLLRDTNGSENNDLNPGLESEMPMIPPIEDMPIDDPWGGGISEYDNALELARSFIGIVPISQANIIEQLMWAGFQDSAIESTMNQLDFEVDWNEQAVWQAQKFMISFEEWTREELYENMIASGFTESQTNHAISQIFSE